MKGGLHGGGAVAPFLVAAVAFVAAIVATRSQAWLSNGLGTPFLAALEFLAFIFFAVAFVLALAPRPKVSPMELGMRRRVFAFNALLLIVLFAIAVLYYRFPFPSDDKALWLKAVLHGIWFAMLGSVAISLKGVYDHTQPSQWDEGWLLWYLGRPFTGAIVGAMTYLILQVANTSQPPSIPTLAVAAFILGTQESRFFGVLSELAKVVLATPASAQGMKVAAITPDHGKPGGAILITGSGFTAGASASLAGTPLQTQVVAADGTALTGLAPAQPVGTAAGQKLDLIVANPSGEAYALPNAFTYN